MLSIVVLDTLNFSEINISSIIKKAYGERELPIKRVTIVHNLQSLLTDEKGQLDRCNVFIGSFGKITDEYIEFAQKLRRENNNIFIIFILDKKVDITYCVRPSIRPSGILFIPLEEIMVHQTIKEVYLEFLRIEEQEKQPVFTIKNNSDIYYINTGEIFLFESKGKKIAVKTKAQEIEFYSNFENVLEQLPNWFMRCHKGFVVNVKQVVSSNFTDMTLTLKDKCVIPISRTYRDEIRAFLNAQGV